MKVLRDPQIVSGFIYEDPVENLGALTHCGEAICIRGHELAMHSHRGFEFLYLSRGEVSWCVGRKQFQQQMGDLFVAYPGERHGSADRAPEESHHLWIGLELEKLGTEGRRLSHYLRDNKVRLLHGCQAIEPVLQAIVGQVVTDIPQRREVISAYLRTLFALINQQSRGGFGGKRKPETVAWPYSYAIQKAVAYMSRHLDRRLSLSELAATASVKQVPHFCTQFQREVGTSPAAYHLQLRLNAARAALLQPALSITLVAMNFGFSSSQHFSTSFQRAFSVTPRAWQKG